MVNMVVDREMNDSKAYLSLGSNMGNRLNYLFKAKKRIEKQLGTIEKESSIYETEPWGNLNQGKFLNQIIIIRTNFKINELLIEVLNIEANLGRIREVKWGSRKIDIDILFYNEVIIKQKDLIIPHPGIPERRFILVPLNEIASTFYHPELGITMKQLLKKCPDSSSVTLIKS